MQFLDDDIDQLFRRASEDYPLNTNSSDWNKIARALDEDKPKNKKNFGRFFKWFIPLSFFWLINTYIGYSDKNGEIPQNNITKQIQVKVQTGNPSSHSDDLNNNNTPSVSELKDLPGPIIKNNNIIISNFPDKKKNEKNKLVIPVSSGFDQSLTLSNTVSITNSTPESFFRLPKLSFEQSSYPRPSIFAPYALFKKPFVINSAKPQRKNIPNSSLYMGILGGVDISMVKFQNVSKVGYKAGVVAGYAFNKRWSLESGAYYDQKSYYSDGKYFNPKLYPNLTINTVDGTCHMIEIPLSIRYNFKKKENTWFATAGLSTYLMKKEDYDFDYSYPPSNRSYQYYKEFKNSTTNWFSILNLSVGYSKKLGAIGDLRIEPYIKAPLKGLGIGKLPISSAGINVGLTHKIF